MKGISTIIQYLECNLVQTFQHPLSSMDSNEMYSFLRGVLQIYLEFWNSTEPPFEYIPDVPQQHQQSTSQQTFQPHISTINEITSLMKHIRSCEFFPHFNNLYSLGKIEKLNTDLIQLLQEYFSQTIWTQAEHNQ